MASNISFCGAFLRCGDDVLLLKRGKHKKYSPGLWAGVGGHIEPFDEGSPITACLREIEEETGITSEAVKNLTLRFFALLGDEKEIHSIYYFTGDLIKKPFLHETDEGELNWVNLRDGLGLPMAAHIKSFYQQMVNNPDDLQPCCFLGEDIKLV